MGHPGVHQAPLHQPGQQQELHQLRPDREDDGEHPPGERRDQQVLLVPVSLLPRGVSLLPPGPGLHPDRVSTSAHLLLHTQVDLSLALTLIVTNNPISGLP